MQCKIQLLNSLNKNAELEAFDHLPQELRTKINYLEDRTDPRQILGIYKQQGLSQALSYLDDIAQPKGTHGLGIL